jgi:biopolymer transport protein TolQ
MGGSLVSLDLFQLVWEASLLVQLVILLLVAASVISWAAILFKWRELSGAEQDSETFLEVYHEGSWRESLDAAKRHEGSPLSTIFLAAHSELLRIAKYRGPGGNQNLDAREQRNISHQLAWASSQEMTRLESRLSFLATTGSAAPFIGLFGTVVGIIDSFTAIGQAGSASLAVVAPGIAEALIATAVGLLAAIPASIFYNVFVARLRELQGAIELFGAEVEEDAVFALADRAPAPGLET